MKDVYNIDGHKLIYHPARVAGWLNGDMVFPVYMEISPSGFCNQACSFCALDYIEDRDYIKTGAALECFSEMAGCGVKSVLFAGEGEPLLHPDIEELVSGAGRAGLDTALTTNGILLDKKDIVSMLTSLEWIRISLDAADRKTYSVVHGCPEADFDRVASNIKRLVDIKYEKGLECAVGVQYLLLPENRAGAAEFVKMMKRLGVDYAVIKPYSEHRMNMKDRYSDLEYSSFRHVIDELENMEGSGYNVTVRTVAMEKAGTPKDYGACGGLDFFAVIDSLGNIFPCASFLGRREFAYGNIYEEKFSRIWTGRKRPEVKKAVMEGFPEHCRRICRMDEINRYLWNLKNPPPHVNFI